MPNPINITTGIGVPFGHPNRTTIYVNGTEYKNWMNFRVVRKLNQMGTFTVYFVGVNATQKLDIKQGSNILFFDEFRLVMKGRIDRVEYKTALDCEVYGYSMKVKLLDKTFDRTDYTNATTATIASDIATFTGLTLGNVDDYGTGITTRFQYDNKLRSATNLATITGFDFWVDSSSAPDYSVDTLNFSFWRGSIVPTQLFYTRGSSKNTYIASSQIDTENMINSIKMLGYGDGVNQTSVNSYLATIAFSTLAADLSAPGANYLLDRQLYVIDGIVFPSSGSSLIRVGNEIMGGATVQGNVISCDRDIASGNCSNYKIGTLVCLFYDGSTSTPAQVEAIAQTDTTITLHTGNTTSFDSAGTLIVNGELITYTSKDATHFLGCSRGQSYTYTEGVYTSSVTAHSTESASGLYVYQFDPTMLYIPQNPQTGSSIAVNGAKEKVIIDQTITTADSVALKASNYLIAYGQPIKRISLDIWNPLRITAQLGDNVDVEDTDTGLSGIYRLVGIERTFDMDSGNHMILEVSNFQLSQLEATDTIKRTVDTSSTYAQGATNITTIAKEALIKNGSPMTFLIYIPPSLVKFNYIKFTFKCVNPPYAGSYVVTAGFVGSETAVATYTSDQNDVDITTNMNWIVNGSGWYDIIITNSDANGNIMSFIVELKGFIQST